MERAVDGQHQEASHIFHIDQLNRVAAVSGTDVLASLLRTD